MSNQALPVPGRITNEAGIPSDLRSIDQWILWKPVKRGDKITKTPVWWQQPFGDAINAHASEYWGSFNQVVQAMRSDEQGRLGIGLVLDDTGIICLDFDDHEGDDKEAVALGAEYASDTLAMNPTYAERSLQGGGRHIFYRAVLPHDRIGGLVEPLNLEIYARQFIAMTGNALPGSSNDVRDGQALVDSWNLPPPVASTGSQVATTALGRALNLSDWDVVQTLMVRRPHTYGMLASQNDFADRSDAFMKIVGDLDKITGDPVQIDRIIRKSPCFKNGYNRERYERDGKWLAKQGCASMLEYWVRDARHDNTESIPFIEYVTPERRAFLDAVLVELRAQNEKMVEQAREREIANAEARVEAAAARERSAKGSTREFSAHVVQAHERIATVIPDFTCELTAPPGIAEKVVRELGQMVTNPHLEYCVPATLFGLSCFHGRRVKDGGDPIYIYSFTTGKMFTGKSRTAEALRDGIGAALAYYHAHPSDRTKLVPSPGKPSDGTGKLYSPIHAGKFKSPHEMHRNIQQHNTFGALMDEAANAVRAFLDNTALAIDFKSYVKIGWDAGKATQSLTPPMSKEGYKAGTQLAVYNPNIPIYATCTEDELEDMNVKELVDGFWSRWIIAYNEFECAPMLRQPEELRKGFSEDLAKLFREWQAVAQDLDAMYVPDQASVEGATANHEISHERLLEIAKDKIVNVTWSPEARDIMRTLSDVLIGITRDAQRRDGKFPKWFEILARSGVMIRRISSLLAASDDYRNPIVTREHVEWAAQYVLYWTSVLLTAHEDGKIAVSLDEGPSIIVDKIRSAGATGDNWITEGDLWIKCKHSFTKFSSKLRGAVARKIFTDALVQLETDGIVIRKKRAQGAKQTYEVPCVTANDLHRAWD